MCFFRSEVRTEMFFLGDSVGSFEGLLGIFSCQCHHSAFCFMFLKAPFVVLVISGIF